MYVGEGAVSRRVLIQVGGWDGSRAPYGGVQQPGTSRRAYQSRAVYSDHVDVGGAAPTQPAAVATTSPAQPRRRPSSAQPPAARTARRCQTTSPPILLAKPDYDAHDPRVTLGWDNYPKNPPKSWDKPAPGTGSTVNAFAVDYYPPPTPYDQNPTWQAVNKALNADFQMTQVSSTDYPLRMATMMAGNDIPDIIHLYRGITGAFVPPGTAEFVKAKCQDLTQFLAGDAIKEYPNLAAIPTYAWSQLGMRHRRRAVQLADPPLSAGPQLFLQEHGHVEPEDRR